jgi:hypothetical protein
MHSMTIATKGFSPLVLLALPDDGSAPQRLPKTIAVPAIRPDRYERPWVSSSVIDGHPFLGASAHSSIRNVMMPITTRAVTTSVHEVFTCSLNIALVPPLLHRKTRNRIFHSSTYKMLFCEVRYVQGPGVLARIVWDTVSQRGTGLFFHHRLIDRGSLSRFLAISMPKTQHRTVRRDFTVALSKGSGCRLGNSRVRQLQTLYLHLTDRDISDPPPWFMYSTIRTDSGIKFLP